MQQIVENDGSCPASVEQIAIVSVISETSWYHRPMRVGGLLLLIRRDETSF
jgi:hypothetical protein